MFPWLDHRALLILVSAGRSKGRQAIHVQFHTDTWIQTFVMGSKRSLVASSYQAPGSLSREGNRTSSSDVWRGLNPLVPILTMVKTRMSRRQRAGLLAIGTLSSANFSSKRLLEHAAGALVFFNGTTDDDGVCFVWHGIAFLLHATPLLAYRCTRNRRYDVSEDEHLQLLSGEGILHNKVPRKRKKCNKTNYV